MERECECVDGMIVVPLLDDTDVAPCPVCEARFYWRQEEDRNENQTEAQAR